VETGNKYAYALLRFTQFACICRMQCGPGQFTSSKPKPDEIAASEIADGSLNWGLV